MQYIKGMSFTGMHRGHANSIATRESIRLMKEKTACNTIVLVIGALQDTAHSEAIDYKHRGMPEDDELIAIIEYCKSLSLRVIRSEERRVGKEC